MRWPEDLVVSKDRKRGWRTRSGRDTENNSQGVDELVVSWITGIKLETGQK